MTERRVLTEQRVVIEALQNLRRKGLLDFKTFSDEWVITYWRDDVVRHILGYYAFDVNAHAAAEIAQDKVATYQLLTDAGLPAVPHSLFSTPPTFSPDAEQLTKLFTKHRELVIKPLDGGSGRDVAKFDSVDAVLRVTTADRMQSWCASPFIDIAYELRLVVHNDSLTFAYRKDNPAVVDGLKMFNLKLGAVGTFVEPTSVDADLQRIAIQAMRVIGLYMGAVDIVFDTQNQAQILEINGRFSIDYFASLSPDNRQKAVTFYETMLAASLER